MRPPTKSSANGCQVATVIGTAATSDGDSNPVIQSMSYGPQQPQSGFLWVRLPANGIIHVKLTSGALLYVDRLALA
ncbi:MAG: hypothetical protein QOD70_3069 [Frankiales bacterium]|nr:hypothetical protein [Frankiales bacterium]